MTNTANMKNLRAPHAPRFYYKKVQQRVSETQKLATELGDVNEAMKQRLAPYADRLPEHSTERIINQIYKTTRTFLEAEDARCSSDDIHTLLTNIVSTLPEEDAYTYLASLRATFIRLDANVDDRINMMSADDIQKEIESNAAAAAASEHSLAEEIDSLVATIEGSSLKSFVFAAGNEQIIEMINEDPQDVAFAVIDVLDNGFAKADNYAMVTCACYEMILEGQIDGLNIENADPQVVATLVSVGLSKGSIIRRLLRGEIDKEMAMELLHHVENALKWVFAKLYQAFMGALVFTGFILILELFDLSSKAVLFLVGLAGVCGLATAVSSEEDARETSEILTSLTKFVLSLPIHAGKFIYDTVKAHSEARQAQSLPQTPVQA